MSLVCVDPLGMAGRTSKKAAKEKEKIVGAIKNHLWGDEDSTYFSSNQFWWVNSQGELNIDPAGRLVANQKNADAGKAKCHLSMVHAAKYFKESKGYIYLRGTTTDDEPDAEYLLAQEFLVDNFCGSDIQTEKNAILEKGKGCTGEQLAGVDLF